MAVVGHIRDVMRNQAFTEDIQVGLRYLSSLTQETFADVSTGAAKRVELKGEALYAIHQVYETKGPGREVFEAHRRYIDIQYILEGFETIKVAALADATTLTAYNDEKDFGLFQVKNYSSLSMLPGMVCILFPEDVHAPGLELHGKGLVRKTVVKIRVNK